MDTGNGETVRLGRGGRFRRSVIRISGDTSSLPTCSKVCSISGAVSSSLRGYDGRRRKFMCSVVHRGFLVKGNDSVDRRRHRTGVSLKVGGTRCTTGGFVSRSGGDSFLSTVRSVTGLTDTKEVGTSKGVSCKMGGKGCLKRNDGLICAASNLSVVESVSSNTCSRCREVDERDDGSSERLGALGCLAG